MDGVGSFQSASLSGESGFGRNESSKYTDWLQCFFRLVRVFRGSVELFRLRACLKSQLSECGRPRPQQCPTRHRPRFLQWLSQCHVAAPEDGRTPSESVFTPQCIFRHVLISDDERR